MLALLGDFLIMPLSVHTQACWHKKIFATVHISCDDVKFCDGSGILHGKSHSHVIALLIHGFFFFKTWLFIAYDVVFFAIICFEYKLTA